jgi:DNA polymerase IIIc chi subunit
MVQVDFHFNAPDKWSYVCRLLRKGSGQGKRMGVDRKSVV